MNRFKKLIIGLILFPTLAIAGTLTIQPILETANTWLAKQTFTTLALTAGTNGHVLTSDASGNLTLQASAGGGGGVSDLAVGNSVGCSLSISGTNLAIAPISSECLIGAKLGSSTDGTTLSFTSTTNVTFGAASDTDGNDFGLTLTDPWDETMPWFLSVIVNSSDNSLFALSKVPVSSSGTVTTSLCQLGDTDCDEQFDVMLLTTGETLSNWTDQPMTTVAWFGGTLSTGLEHTFTLPANSGFNRDWKKQRFGFPDGTNGNVTGKFCNESIGGGICAVFATNDWDYAINDDGSCSGYINLRGDGGVDSSGGGQWNMAIPLRAKFPYDATVFSAARYMRMIRGAFFAWGQETAADATYVLLGGIGTDPYILINFKGSHLGGSTNLTNSRFSNGDRNLNADFEWPCY